MRGKGIKRNINPNRQTLVQLSQNSSTLPIREGGDDGFGGGEEKVRCEADSELSQTSASKLQSKRELLRVVLSNNAKIIPLVPSHLDAPKIQDRQDPQETNTATRERDAQEA